MSQPEDIQPPNGAPGDIPEENLPEERDAVWELLQKARQVEPGPHFTGNVVREVRELGSSGPAPLSKIIPFPRLAYAAAALILLSLAVLQVLRSPTPSGDEIVVAPEAGASQVATAGVEAVASTEPLLEDPAAAEQSHGDYQDELEIIDYLDGLLAVGDVQSLTDDDLAELLF